MMVSMPPIIRSTSETPMRTSSANLSISETPAVTAFCISLTMVSMSLVARAVWSASLPISRATTENPSP